MTFATVDDEWRSSPPRRAASGLAPHHRHEPHVHVKLLMAVHERKAGPRVEDVDVDLTPRRHDDDVLAQSGGGAAVEPHDLEQVAVDVDGMRIRALIVERPSIALGRPHDDR